MKRQLAVPTCHVDIIDGSSKSASRVAAEVAVSQPPRDQRPENCTSKSGGRVVVEGRVGDDGRVAVALEYCSSLLPHIVSKMKVGKCRVDHALSKDAC